MLRAFAIVCLVMSIYAIVGTDFYGSVDPENFGSFVMTFYTLFEAMTFTLVEVASGRFILQTCVFRETLRSRVQLEDVRPRDRSGNKSESFWGSHVDNARENWGVDDLMID